MTHSAFARKHSTRTFDDLSRKGYLAPLMQPFVGKGVVVAVIADIETAPFVLAVTADESAAARRREVDGRMAASLSFGRPR